MHLTGKRLILKSLTIKEANSKYLSWLCDKEVTKYMCTQYSTLPQLVTYVNNKMNDKNCLCLCIFLGDEHIGNIKIDLIDHQLKTGRLGMMIGEKKYWNKGYGNEALSLLLNHMFIEKKWNKLDLGVEKENINAISLYKKNGFKFNGLTFNGIQKDSALGMTLK